MKLSWLLTWLGCGFCLFGLGVLEGARRYQAHTESGIDRMDASNIALSLSKERLVIGIITAALIVLGSVLRMKEKQKAK